MILAATDTAPWAGAMVLCVFFAMCAVLGWAERKYPSCDCHRQTQETEKEEHPEPQNGDGGGTTT